MFLQAILKDNEAKSLSNGETAPPRASGDNKRRATTQEAAPVQPDEKGKFWNRKENNRRETPLHVFRVYIAAAAAAAYRYVMARRASFLSGIIYTMCRGNGMIRKKKLHSTVSRLFFWYGPICSRSILDYPRSLEKKTAGSFFSQRCLIDFILFNLKFSFRKIFRNKWIVLLHTLLRGVIVH